MSGSVKWVLRVCKWQPTPVVFPGSSTGKESTCNAGDPGWIPGSGRSPGEGKGYPLQCSGLENSMDYAVHGISRVRHDLATEPSPRVCKAGRRRPALGGRRSDPRLLPRRWRLAAGPAAGRADFPPCPARAADAVARTRLPSPGAASVRGGLSPPCAPAARPGKRRADGARPLPAGLRRLPPRPSLAPSRLRLGFPSCETSVGPGVREEGGGVRERLEAGSG